MERTANRARKVRDDVEAVGSIESIELILHHLVDLNGEITAGAGSERWVHTLTKLRMQRRIDRGETRQRPARLRVGCRVVMAQELFPPKNGIRRWRSCRDPGDLPNLLEVAAEPRRLCSPVGTRARVLVAVGTAGTDRSSRRLRTGRIRPCLPECIQDEGYQDERVSNGGLMGLHERTIPSDAEYLSWRDGFAIGADGAPMTRTAR